jgi:hypothetical protein
MESYILNKILQNITSVRGAFRLGTVAPIENGDDFSLQGNKPDHVIEPHWLRETSKLIPGEALAAYLSLQAVAQIAKHPANVKITLAIIFLLVTIILRWIGSQDPTNPKPRNTSQLGVVLISAFSFVFLVYASGGQIYWHNPFDDQQTYGQIAAAALGVVGPSLHKHFSLKTKP